MRDSTKVVIVLLATGPFALVMAIPFLLVKGYVLCDAVFEYFMDKLEKI